MQPDEIASSAQQDNEGQAHAVPVQHVSTDQHAAVQPSGQASPPARGNVMASDAFASSAQHADQPGWAPPTPAQHCSADQALASSADKDSSGQAAAACRDPRVMQPCSSPEPAAGAGQSAGNSPSSHTAAHHLQSFDSVLPSLPPHASIGPAVFSRLARLDTGTVAAQQQVRSCCAHISLLLHSRQVSLQAVC